MNLGVVLESPLSYGYGQIGQQKSISQRTRKGRRVNIMGVWEEETKFEYALKVGTYKTKNYLHFMNWQAERAMKRLFETGNLTVVIHDNASIHRSKVAKKQAQIWSKQGLSVFFLPPYSPEMNRIEEQWRRAYRLMSSKTTTGGFSNRALKRQELGGYVLEDEYDLALAIIDGIENRGQHGNYAVERLMFN
jgi:putative transposase